MVWMRKFLPCFRKYQFIIYIEELRCKLISLCKGYFIMRYIKSMITKRVTLWNTTIYEEKARCGACENIVTTRNQNPWIWRPEWWWYQDIIKISRTFGERKEGQTHGKHPLWEWARWKQVVIAAKMEDFVRTIGLKDAPQETCHPGDEDLELNVRL